MINWNLYSCLYWTLDGPYDRPHYLSYYNSPIKNENKHYLRDNEDTDYEYEDHGESHSYGSQCRYPYSGVVIMTHEDKRSVNYEYPPLELRDGNLDRLGNSNLPAYNHNIHPLIPIDYRWKRGGIDEYKYSLTDDRNKYYCLRNGDDLYKMHPYGNSPAYAVYTMYYTPSRKEWNPADLVFTTHKFINQCVNGISPIPKSLHDSLILLLMNEPWDYVLTDSVTLATLIRMISTNVLPDHSYKIVNYDPKVVDTMNMHDVPLSCALVTNPSLASDIDDVVAGRVLVISINNKSYVRSISDEISARGSLALPVVIYGIYNV